MSNDRTITKWYRQERTNTHNPGDWTDFSFQVRISLENSSTGTVVLSCWGAYKNVPDAVSDTQNCINLGMVALTRNPSMQRERDTRATGSCSGSWSVWGQPVFKKTNRSGAYWAILAGTLHHVGHNWYPSIKLFSHKLSQTRKSYGDFLWKI